ncbi:nucleotide sugar dehydrogenase [Amycolatopsis rifamycinica]|uniref:UDP-N-acetyl-D-glucosamine dehydrogenase n=1 Tax=Amycolatopsis rifamycinica TaxID=287986 RepID=A0A066U585_9PSEU|nr:nucleotide sugar dehydrogenase [Amycolatopsis rifamycinica]KDN22611.1 UDP-N-acetyl-D-glucosamine dehydrogenase [Amycolatopsis rifamycinica]
MRPGADLVVVGLGYAGLPLAETACRAGLGVTGFDVDGTVVETLAAGRSPVTGVSDADVAAMLDAGFTASADPAQLDAADTVVICVPTGLTADRAPDLGPLRAASATVGDRLRPGTLVVLESTSFPGTTEEVVLPILERCSGLRAGDDFYLAFAPERIDPGNRRFGLAGTPKVIGGHTPLCAKYCATFYSRFVDAVVVARGTREAELAKLLENTYRFVNIALVNEFARYCETTGIDVWDVVHCAGTKPFGFASFHPGPGVGGHCIPVDPVYLTTRAGQEGFTFTLVDAAARVNEQLPVRVVDRAGTLLGDLRGAAVLLLGVTYKADVADVRESPARPIAAQLLARGAEVTYHDPHAAGFDVGDRPLRRATDLRAAAAAADLTILLQDHRDYDLVLLANASRLLLDTRGKASGCRVRHL